MARLIPVIGLVAVVVAVVGAGVATLLATQAAPAALSVPIETSAALSLLEDSGAAMAVAQVGELPAVDTHEAQLRAASLSLLEDSGAAVAGTHVQNDLLRALTEGQGGSRHESLLARLRNETSSFRGGIGLEGKAMVNGKEFSWANVNLSNISWG